MSIHMMNLVWRSADVKGGTLLTLLALADYANDDGIAWPSVGSLMTKTRQSERTVQSALRQLEEIKHIEREQESLFPSNTYRINIELLTQGGAKFAPPQGCKPRQKRGAIRDVKSAPNTSTTISKSNYHYSDDFEAFFRAYPRPLAKRAADRAYKAALERLQKGEFKQEQLALERAQKCLLVAAERFTKIVTNERREEQFIPHPATWLNGSAYLDVFGAKSAVAPVSSESERPSLLDKVREQLNGGKK